MHEDGGNVFLIRLQDYAESQLHALNNHRR
jgi:hypothetical protein